MKDLRRSAKICLWVGIIVYMVSCAIVGVFELNTTDTWLALMMMVIIYIPFALSGYFYTSQPKIKKLKRFYVIRILMIFYVIVLTALIFRKLIIL